MKSLNLQVTTFCPLSLILIDHIMVLGYDYSKQKRWWRQINAPHPPAVLMATAVRRSNTDGIA
jgi:hypothetical protein